MMKTVSKRVVTLAVCVVTVLCGIFACAGATNDYEIPQIDDMPLKGTAKVLTNIFRFSELITKLQ